MWVTRQPQGHLVVLAIRARFLMWGREQMGVVWVGGVRGDRANARYGGSGSLHVVV